MMSHKTNEVIIVFSKAHDGKHYLDNQPEDSSNSYLAKGK